MNNESTQVLVFFAVLVIIFIVLTVVTVKKRSNRLEEIKNFANQNGWEFQKDPTVFTNYLIKTNGWSVEQRAPSRSNPSSNSKREQVTNYFFTDLKGNNETLIMSPDIPILGMLFSNQVVLGEFLDKKELEKTDIKLQIIENNFKVEVSDKQWAEKMINDEFKKELKNSTAKDLRIIAIGIVGNQLIIRTPRIDKIENLQTLIEFGQKLKNVVQKSI